jgi:hypothetical protein
MTNFEKVNKDIKRQKNLLIHKAKKQGLYENFGQDEVRKLRDKYCILSCTNDREAFLSIANFDEWCMNYTGRK